MTNSSGVTSTGLALSPPNASLRASATDYVLALLAACCIASAFVAARPTLLHPLIVPLVIAGAIGGVDAVRALRHRLDLLDPQALLGFFAWHFFLLAPLLHLYWNVFLPYVQTPVDWRPWFERMAWWNVAGVLVFRTVLHVWSRVVPDRPARRRWDRDRNSFWPLMWLFLLAALGAELWVLATTGTGYLQDPVTASQRFTNLGWLLAISNSLPLLVLLAVIFGLRDREIRPSLPITVTILAIFAALELVVGGLRGSRGVLIYSVVIAVGAVHFLLRPLSRRFLLVSVLVGLVFMYFYGFYKSAGTQALTELTSRGGQVQLEQQTGRTFQTLLLEDLGRSDVQALILERLNGPAAGYRFRFGETYGADLAEMVPSAILPTKPADKRVPGTEVLYGKSVLDSGFLAENIYGLSGEWILNFGTASLPIAFALFAIACCGAFRFCRRLERGDSRVFLISLIGILAVLGLSSDFDNVLYAALNYGLLPFLALAVGSTHRALVRQRSQGLHPVA